MRRIVFEDYESLSDYMINNAEDGKYVVTVLFYEDALNLLRELMMYDEVQVTALDIEPVNYSGYDKEYYISLNENLEAAIEPAYANNGYLGTDADLMLVDADANSAVLKIADKEACREIYIGYEDDVEDCDECCECCPLNDSKDGGVSKDNIAVDKDGYVTLKVDADTFFNYLFG